MRHAVALQYSKLLEVMQQDQQIQKQGPDNNTSNQIGQD